VCMELVFCGVFFTGAYTLARGKKGPPTFVDRFFGFGMGYGDDSSETAMEKKTE
jgi:hypothetical protein